MTRSILNGTTPSAREQLLIAAVNVADVLTTAAVEGAIEAGRRLKARVITFNVAFTSALTRAQKRDQALNERHYDDLRGLNKVDAREKMGACGAEVITFRRREPQRYASSSLLLPALFCRQSSVGTWWPVAAHGALVMVPDRLTPETIPAMELATGVPFACRVNAVRQLLQTKLWRPDRAVCRSAV